MRPWSAGVEVCSGRNAFVAAMGGTGRRTGGADADGMQRFEPCSWCLARAHPLLRQRSVVATACGQVRTGPAPIPRATRCMLRYSAAMLEEP